MAPKPQATQAPSVYGLTSYLPMSSSTNPMASNYVNTSPNASYPNMSTQLNAYGAPLYRSNAWNTNERVANTNPRTGALAPTPQPGPAPAPQQSNNYSFGDPNNPDLSNPVKQTDYNNWKNSGNGTQSIEDLISEQYGPALEALRGIEGSLLTGKTESLGNVESQFGTGGENIGREQTELEASLAEQGRRLGESARGAYADATRAYNNLVQQGMSRFGAGSSAGGAIQELVNQEFLRSRGKMGQQEVQGQQDLGMEQTKLNNYIAQKKGDLDTWKNDAILKINENFRSSMDEIAFRKGDIEANKTRDKIAALQSAVNQANEIKSANRQYLLGLAEFTVGQMQEQQGRAFTPQEVAGVVAQFLAQENQIFSQNTGGQPLANNISPFRQGKKEDELKGLVSE